MKRLLLLASAFSICSLSHAQTYTEVPLTGYSADVIANGAGSVTTSTTMDMDGAGFAFVSMDFVSPTNQSPTSALPTNGKINSAATSGLTYQLAPYTANNSLRLSGVNTGTLTFGTPRSADQVYVLATSGSGNSTVTITVNFTDATSQIFTQTINDWFGGTGYAIQGISRVGHPSSIIENSSTNPRLYQYLLTINAASTLKPIQSITFNKTSTGTGVLNVMAVTIRATAPAFANDISVSGISGISSGCGLSNQETISISIYNPGSAQQANFPVSYRVNNATPVTENFTGTIAPAGTTTYTFNAKADLSAVGTHTIVAKTHLSNDSNLANDSTKISAINSLLPGLPVSLDYETANSGLGVFQTSVKTKSTITEGTGGSNGTGSTKGMIMSGIASSAWVMPVGSVDPYAMNPEHKAIAKICISPAGGSASDSLWLTFDLRQLFKTANANTNFRVTVNGNPVGPANFRPPFAGSGNWQKVKIDLNQFKTLPTVEIGFESSVSEDYANGNGPANLVDNIKVMRRIVSSIKDEVLQSQLNVYPNPSAGIFTVEIPEGKKCLFEVTDLTGKTIKTQTGNSGINKLTLEGAAKGIYLLKVTSEKGIAVKKISIQ